MKLEMLWARTKHTHIFKYQSGFQKQRPVSHVLYHSEMNY